MGTNYLVLGNPGCGKSTFSNGFIKRPCFRSGISLGGLTTDLQIQIGEFGNKYMDSPGLSDIINWTKSADSIYRALTQDGTYKLIVVIALESGRIRPDDKQTAKLILNSASISSNQYSIIVNKVEPEILEILNTNSSQKTEMIRILNEGLPGTNSIYFYPLEEYLRGKSDRVPVFSQEFQSWIQGAPTIRIIPLNVKKILSPEEEAKIQSEVLRKKIEEEKRILDEERKNQEKQRIEQQARLDKQQADQNAMIAEQARIAAQQRAYYEAQIGNANRSHHRPCIVS